MCGIVGAVGLAEPLRPELAAELLGLLHHRGPDSEGAWRQDSCWMGFRRLAILDLEERANQPMQDPVSGVVIVFNGEIYNYLELRDELAARGHTFETTGDTEILLRGYLQWGDGLWSRCNGMWAVALRDPARRGLLLARDRFGEKPLYYGRDPSGAWWFGSDVRVLQRAGVGAGRLDRAQAMGFLTWGDIEDPCASYIDGIHQLPPGSRAELTAGGLTRLERFWCNSDVLAAARERPRPEPDEVDEALDRSVRLRLRSDVEIGTSLSGGVDSPSVVAALRTVDPTRVLHGFTASFPGSRVDEWDRARKVAEQLGVVLHRVEPTCEGFLDELDDLVSHQGAPIEGPTVYASYCVMRRARREQVTVLLDGQGADEMFGGYPKYAGYALWDDVVRGRFGRLRRASQLVGLREGGVATARQAVALSLSSELRQLVLRGWARRASFLGPAFDDVRPKDPYGHLVGDNLLDRAVHADLERVLLPRLLRYADRNSMAWSREIRLPFLDPDLVDLGLRAGWRAGFRNGWTKELLRQSAAPRLPAEVVWRREKLAYAAPEDAWRADPRVQEAVGDAASDLTRRNILRGAGSACDPWRVLSLAAFMASHDLTT